jgi:hypothetical protein
MQFECPRMLPCENPQGNFLNKKSPDRNDPGLLEKNFGGDLLSHTGPRAVPSALKSLTSVFGMGTGVASSLLPPKNRKKTIYMRLCR